MTMKLVMDLVTTVLLLVALVAAQKPSILADASIDVREQASENGPLLGILMNIAENSPGKDLDSKKNEIFGKDLDSEENSEEYDGDDDDDDDSEESSKEEENEDDDDNDEESNDRFKRKVIFRGGGGGIYSRGGVRRGGGGGGGGGNDDPYGRRRGHQGPDYGPYESWPYRRPDTPFVDVPSTSTKKKTDTAPVYGTTRTTSSDTSEKKSGTSGIAAITATSRSSSRPASSPTVAATSAAYGISNASGRGDGRRTKTERRETSKTKLSKNLKWEIAQYALQHGATRAADHFEDRVGRKLRVKKVEKFMKRYQSKM